MPFTLLVRNQALKASPEDSSQQHLTEPQIAQFESLINSLSALYLENHNKKRIDAIKRTTERVMDEATQLLQSFSDNAEKKSLLQTPDYNKTNATHPNYFLDFLFRRVQYIIRISNQIRAGIDYLFALPNQADEHYSASINTAALKAFEQLMKNSDFLEAFIISVISAEKLPESKNSKKLRLNRLSVLLFLAAKNQKVSKKIITCLECQRTANPSYQVTFADLLNELPLKNQVRLARIAANSNNHAYIGAAQTLATVLTVDKILNPYTYTHTLKFLGPLNEQLSSQRADLQNNGKYRAQFLVANSADSKLIHNVNEIEYFLGTEGGYENLLRKLIRLNKGEVFSGFAMWRLRWNLRSASSGQVIGFLRGVCDHLALLMKLAAAPNASAEVKTQLANYQRMVEALFKERTNFANPAKNLSSSACLLLLKSIPVETLLTPRNLRPELFEKLTNKDNREFNKYLLKTSLSSGSNLLDCSPETREWIFSRFESSDNYLLLLKSIPVETARILCDSHPELFKKLTNEDNREFTKYLLKTFLSSESNLLDYSPETREWIFSRLASAETRAWVLPKLKSFLEKEEHDPIKIGQVVTGILARVFELEISDSIRATRLSEYAWWKKRFPQAFIIDRKDEIRSGLDLGFPKSRSNSTALLSHPDSDGEGNKAENSSGVCVEHSPPVFPVASDPYKSRFKERDVPEEEEDEADEMELGEPAPQPPINYSGR